MSVFKGSPLGELARIRNVTTAPTTSPAPPIGINWSRTNYFPSCRRR